MSYVIIAERQNSDSGAVAVTRLKDRIVLTFTLNGKPMQTDDLAKALMRHAADAVAQTMRDKLGAIRHPDTGEFPMVIVDGESLEDMRLRVEGSTELLAIVKSRLSAEEQEQMSFIATDSTQVPHAFLSYGWEDRGLAEKIAQTLVRYGIKTWWAEWEVRAGDSIRRKIDEGLANCTHFIVLLTPNSITRPWVNEEMDAAFMRKVNAKSRFIPLRYGLAPEALPPLLSGMLSPEVDAEVSDLQKLIADIKGLNRKPSQRQVADAPTPVRTGYSPAATAIAELFVKASQNGMVHDPVMLISDIASATDLHADDVTDAVYELRAFLDTWSSLGSLDNEIYPKNALFSKFDHYWQEWNPAEDALKLAANLVNDPVFPDALHEIAEKYGWPARRLNPAANYLVERDVVKPLETLGSAPFSPAYIMRTDATRRFVKSRI